jgi:hypothetical protein
MTFKVLLTDLYGFQKFMELPVTQREPYSDPFAGPPRYIELPVMQILSPRQWLEGIPHEPVPVRHRVFVSDGPPIGFYWPYKEVPN